MSTEKIIENTTTISDKLVEYMNSAEQVIQQYGGDAAELGLNVLRIEAGYNLIYALLFGTISVIALYYSTWAFKKGLAIQNYQQEQDEVKQEKLKQMYRSDLEALYFILGAVGGVVSSIALVVNFSSLVNIWYWIGLFWPEAYAVHKFLM